MRHLVRAILIWGLCTGCRTVSVVAPREILIRCHKAAPAHWVVVTDGTDRLALQFPTRPLPEELPCPSLPPTP